MSMKLAVWEVGKADPRFDRAEDLPGLIELLKALKAGENAILFYNEDPKVVNFQQILEFTVEPQPESMYQDLYTVLSTELLTLLTPEQIETLDAKLTSAARKHDRV